MHNIVNNLISIQNELKIKIKKLNFKNYNPSIIAVSKTFTIKDILPLINYGHIHFGENKVQEGMEKLEKRISVLRHENISLRNHIEMLNHRLESVLSKKNCLLTLAYEVNDPGNLGTMFRTSRAFGADAMLLSKGSVDPYNPKVVRAAAGALFSLPFISGVDGQWLLEEARDRKIKTLALDADTRAAEGGIVAALGPHATDTVSPALWSRIAEISQARDLPIHVHVAQSVEEQERSFEHHGCSPIERLDRLGVLAAGVGIPDGPGIEQHAAVDLNAHLEKPRERYNALMEDPGHIEAVLQKGAERAREETAVTMDRLRAAVGLGRFN